LTGRAIGNCVQKTRKTGLRKQRRLMSADEIEREGEKFRWRFKPLLLAIGRNQLNQKFEQKNLRFPLVTSQRCIPVEIKIL